MNSQHLFRRSRLRLAGWYALVMGAILSVCGGGMYHALMRSNWMALEREIESIAGTLHDSLEPMLPSTNAPLPVLQRILPDLCVVGQPCEPDATLIQRHTMGISDRSLYYIRLFDHHGQLLAFSPNQPGILPTEFDGEIWQTIQTDSGRRYHQFTTLLHNADHEHPPGAGMDHEHESWGYLQVGRTLAAFDGEKRRLQWILGVGVPLALGLVGVASWGLSGLAMQPIYQSYERQQQFTANVAHELRSPLASLLATVEAAQRLPVTTAAAAEPEMMPMLHTLERQGRRLSQLVTDLLLLTSLEQGAIAAPVAPCCLNDIVADLTEEYAELAIAAGLEFQGDIPDRALMVLGDESQLYRLVANLIANAIHYTPAGGSVWVRLTGQERTAMIAVHDTGIGIAPADQARIFERFYRVQGDRSRKTGGTGLGLAIATAIAERHHGQITITSTPAQGSTFTVQLPQAPRPPSPTP